MKQPDPEPSSAVRVQKLFQLIGNPWFLLWGAIALLVIQFFFFATVVWLAREHPTQNLSNSEWRGQFGDAFGALNTTFTGLAFIGLLHTIALQRRELEESRQQTSDARGALEAEHKARAYAEVERSLFETLRLYQCITQGFRDPSELRSFKFFADKLKGELHDQIGSHYAPTPTVDSAWQGIEDAFKRVWEAHYGSQTITAEQLFHIAEVLRVSLDFVEDERVSLEQRQRCIDLICCQLSPEEVFVLTFLALWPARKGLRRSLANGDVFRRLEFSWLKNEPFKDCLRERFALAKEPPDVGRSVRTDQGAGP